MQEGQRKRWREQSAAAKKIESLFLQEKANGSRGINKTYPPHDPEEVVALGTGRSQHQLGVGEAVREALAHHAEDGFATVVNERPVPRDARAGVGGAAAHASA
jgi:hypothetical protein